MFFKVAQKVQIYLATLSEKICHQKLSQIAQSGRTAFASFAQYSVKKFQTVDSLKNVRRRRSSFQMHNFAVGF